MSASGSNRDAGEKEYRYHVQDSAPSSKPPRVGVSTTDRAGHPGDGAFARHVRTFVLVALFMAGFLGLTLFVAIKSWQVRQSRVTRGLDGSAIVDESPWRAAQGAPTVGLFADAGSEAEIIHEAELLARQAELMVAATNYREAVRLYTDAIQTWPGLASAYPVLGRLLLDLRNDQRAQAILERAVEHQPASADVHNDLGVAYLRMNRFDRALIQFQTALTIQPDHAPALFNESLSLRAAGRMPEARRALDHYLQLRPDDPQGLKEKAFFVAAEGHYEAALGILDRIMLSFPTWPPAYFDAAATAALMKEPERAIHLLRKAETLTSSAAVYLVYQQPAFHEVRVTEPGKLFQRDLVRRAQSGGAPVRPPPGSRGEPQPMLSNALE